MLVQILRLSMFLFMAFLMVRLRSIVAIGFIRKCRLGSLRTPFVGTMAALVVSTTVGAIPTCRLFVNYTVTIMLWEEVICACSHIG